MHRVRAAVILSLLLLGSVLNDPKAPARLKSYDLMWLLHLAGDILQMQAYLAQASLRNLAAFA